MDSILEQIDLEKLNIKDLALLLKILEEPNMKKDEVEVI